VGGGGRRVEEDGPGGLTELAHDTKIMGLADRVLSMEDGRIVADERR
jgi:hypothetical protein